jgi:DNA-binding transcriptional ArsR family regulator
MADRLYPHGDNDHRLTFACACASAIPSAADPWVAIVNQRKLNDGTKERILNAIYRQPRTITQLADRLGISAPAVHRHVMELLADDLIHEVDGAEPGRTRATERYYQPTFPVILAADRATFQPALDDLAAAMADVFQARHDALEAAFRGTNLSAGGESFEELLHYLYATATRIARERLEAAGNLPAWPEHGDGSRWVWWAEEGETKEVA